MGELVFLVLFGCLLGVIAGLIPGIHANSIALIAASIALSQPEGIALMIVAMAVVQAFVDFIPSILLSVPESESFLSVLPGHRMFLKGNALLAIKLTIFGGMVSGLAAVLLTPFFFLFFSKTRYALALLVAPLLVLMLALMLYSEKNRLWGAIVILFSGLLGLMVLNSNLQVSEPLFPLVTGFFGVSSIIQSILSEPKKVKQENRKNYFSLQKILFGSTLSVLSGMIVAVLPSIGANQAAFIVKRVVGRIRTSTFLILLGGISTANTIFAFFALFALEKTRSGTAAAVKNLVGLNQESLLLIIATIVTAIGFGAMATIFLSQILLKKMEKINYKKLNFFVLLGLVALTIAFSGFPGLIVLITATSIGLTAIFSGVKRSNCMAFLMTPTLLYYLTQYYL